jgi:hypothetical protein
MLQAAVRWPKPHHALPTPMIGDVTFVDDGQPLERLGVWGKAFLPSRTFEFLVRRDYGPPRLLTEPHCGVEAPAGKPRNKMRHKAGPSPVNR